MGACAGSVATAVAFAIALAQFGRPSWRAAMFGSAAAIMFAFTAALIKQVTGDFHPTWYLFLTHWHVYAMVLTGLVAVFLTQNAYHAGPVTASQAALVIVDPLASMAIGLALFGDRIHTSGLGGPLEDRRPGEPLSGRPRPVQIAARRPHQGRRARAPRPARPRTHSGTATSWDGARVRGKAVIDTARHSELN